MPDAPPIPDARPWTHRWASRSKHPERRGQLCRLVPASFKKGYALGFGVEAGFPVRVEFQDGITVDVHRTAIVPLRQGRGTDDKAAEARTMVSRAWGRLNRGDRARARTEAEKALRLMPGSPGALAVLRALDD